MTKRKSTTLPSARYFSWFVFGCLGFILGLALFMPWNRLWASVLVDFDARNTALGMRWDSVDRGGPLGFRVTNLRLSFAQGNGTFCIHRAFVSLGYSPLIRVELDTEGSQCLLELRKSGHLCMQGDLNLSTLLGGVDFKGVVAVKGDFEKFDVQKGDLTGVFSFQAEELLLPSDSIVSNIVLTAELEKKNVQITKFSMQHPYALTVSGQGQINTSEFFQSRFVVSGESVVGLNSVPYEKNAHLADILW